jgi:DNA invertase Pin-like site-specific DNA recombinase
MNAGKCVAYYRVSTKRQGDSGLGLEAQRHAVQSFLGSGHGSLIAEFTEVESGRQDQRPKLHEALKLCRVTGSKLVVAKLDRLSRNLGFLVSLQEAGVPFVCADNPTANELTIHLLSVLAQHERRVISERTKAALQAAKSRGIKLGNPNIGQLSPNQREAANAARSRLANVFVADIGEIIQDIRERGIVSLTGIARELNQREIPTQRGGRWQATQVRRVLERLQGRNTASGISENSNDIHNVTGFRIDTIGGGGGSISPVIDHTRGNRACKQTLNRY